MQSNKKLSDYIGKNEKTKVIAKIQKASRNHKTKRYNNLIYL